MSVATNAPNAAAPAAEPTIDRRDPATIAVAVIIVNFDTGHLLAQCLAAFQAQDHPQLEIVVIDNASRDGSREVLADLERAATTWRHPTRFVRNAANRGYCGAINDGLRLVDAPVVVFSNVDVEPAPDLISTSVASLVAEPRRGSVQPLLLRPSRHGGDRQVDTTGHVMDRARLVVNRDEGRHAPTAHPGEIFGVSGALAVHRRAMLDDVAWNSPGGHEVLTERLFAFFDDVELDWRARLLGWQAWFEPRAVAFHERGGAGSRRTGRVESLNFANRLLVIVTCDDVRSIIVHAPMIAGTTILKAAELLVTRPGALLGATGRIMVGLPSAWARRRQLTARLRIARSEIVRRWMDPFNARRWVSGWWRRTRAASKST